MRLVISIAIAITAFVCAAGKVFAEPVSTLELKPNSCGAWIEERSPAYNAPKFREAWLTGFLTGANVWGDFDTDILKDVDTTAVSAWIDNYCKANPLEKLNKAVTQLIRDLADRAKKTNDGHATGYYERGISLMRHRVRVTTGRNCSTQCQKNIVARTATSASMP